MSPADLRRADEIIRALETVRDGEPSGLRSVLPLARELLATGASNKAIAAALRCSEGTVEFHVTNILARAHVDGRAALVAAVWSAPR